MAVTNTYRIDLGRNILFKAIIAVEEQISGQTRFIKKYLKYYK